jgi:hypothetical protein
MRPGWFGGAFGLLETATLDVCFRAWLDEEQDAFFGAVSFKQGLRGAARRGR